MPMTKKERRKRLGVILSSANGMRYAVVCLRQMLVLGVFATKIEAVTFLYRYRAQVGGELVLLQRQVGPWQEIDL